MENFCECENYYDVFKEIVKHFMSNYGKFLKIKGKDITNKDKYDKLEALYKTLNQEIKSLPDKGNDCISSMKKCKNKHKSELEDINSKIEKVEILSQRIEDYHNKLLKEIPDELEEYSDDEDEENKNKININNEEEIEENLYENVDVRKTMENDQKNITIIYDLLNNEEIKAKKEEEKREIIKLKNQLMEMWNHIEVELNQQGEQIENVEENIENGLNQVEKGDDELEKAAKIAITSRRLKYQVGLGLTLGAIGTVVPGIGNAIGVALGGLIGYGLYRIDKHRLNKALKKKKEMREKKNKK